MGFYADRVFPVLESLASRRFDADRRALLAAARGEVLEIGFGSGQTLKAYGPGVGGLTGIEPNAGMLARAREAAAAWTSFPVSVVEAPAEALPFLDARFDCAVSSLVLCSVADPARVLAELKRTLKPGGTLLFLEHGRKPSGAGRCLQEALDPVWRRLACGCSLTREPVAAIEAAGFVLERVALSGAVPASSVGSPTWAGVARRP